MILISPRLDNALMNEAARGSSRTFYFYGRSRYQRDLFATLGLCLTDGFFVQRTLCARLAP